MIWPCCPKVPRSWRVDGLTLTATFEGPSAHDPLGRFYRAHPLFIPSQLQLLEEKVIMLMVFFTPSTTVKAGHLLCRVISELFAIISPCWALTCETCHAVKAWPHAALKKCDCKHCFPIHPHLCLMCHWCCMYLLRCYQWVYLKFVWILLSCPAMNMFLHISFTVVSGLQVTVLF